MRRGKYWGKNGKKEAGNIFLPNHMDSLEPFVNFGPKALVGNRKYRLIKKKLYLPFCVPTLKKNEKKTGKTWGKKTGKNMQKNSFIFFSLSVV